MNKPEAESRSYWKYVDTKRLYRVPGAFFIIFGGLYLYWLAIHLNFENIFISVLFFIAQLFIYISFTISIRNHWNSKYRTARPRITKAPAVAVVVPTCNEPVEILERTLKSILNISYDGEVIILVSNDSRNETHNQAIEDMMGKMARYWHEKAKARSLGYHRDLHLQHTSPHVHAKAGNLEQSIAFFRKYYPHIDFLLTQDTDELVKPEILKATMGYFEQDTNVAYVQTIKRVEVTVDDPFGNGDVLWYARTAPSRDYDNAMFACGSGVVWRISAVESVGGFSKWNLVEDLTTSYHLLAAGWEGRYHYESLSKGLAPEDLPNYIKQRGTWALDTIRIFLWDNPLFKKNLTLRQKLQFLELPLFYLNAVFLMLLIITTSISLLFGIWPTTATALEHALFLLPGFVFMETYSLLLAGNIPVKRTRQLQIGMSPIFALAAIKALIYGPNKKPTYKVTLKENSYGNYIKLVAPQVVIVALLSAGIIKSISGTPLYSRFDWSIVFWGLYQTSFYIQIIRVSWWKWRPEIALALPRLQLPFRLQTNVDTSYSPDTL